MSKARLFESVTPRNAAEPSMQSMPSMPSMPSMQSTDSAPELPLHIACGFAALAFMLLITLLALAAACI
jgi:hypothetical protein